MKKDWQERFWEKVDKTDTCWNWTGPLHVGGYGINGRKMGTTFVAHRISYQLLVGEIPKGLVLDHLCFNRKCVNPAHLEPKTLRENLTRVDPEKLKSKPEGWGERRPRGTCIVDTCDNLQAWSFGNKKKTKYYQRYCWSHKYVRNRPVETTT